ncbi:prenyltransferase/squalene oxidase repeat-containing protein [Streptomyces dysideae]|uniref:Squalene cyclase C-terminal domain-containing protein n=1 Tax=Streptomyces dysideae TaxID=909626 RepID=A0A101V4V9_9ACTN|nr:prenyltransferase/squalene oxidase repeat-containing protein [Streptomyces dysideae]KUO22538.1 hypothetical protein AQJ91_03390 [Streptomyces dysideae]
MNVRRSAAVLAATTVIGMATPAAAADSSPSASPSVELPSGLYGTTDPTYDGVWRQSLALLAQDSVGVRPAAKAVFWLTGQQCANGAFAAYRADTAKACDAKLMVDTNSTAAAVQALAALRRHNAATDKALAALAGYDAVTDKAVAWLKSVQNRDGGWGYAPGGASDTNSTSVVIGALAAVGEKPAEAVRDGKSPYDALLKLALPCDDGGGAFAYQPDEKGKLAANADATAAGVLGALGTGLVVKAGKSEGAVCADPGTPEQAAANGAAYLTKAVAKDGHLTSALAGADDRPDYGNTADTVIALAAQGGTAAAQKPLKWLEQNAVTWAEQSGPAAYAQLILAAHAAGTDPRDFGGTDLVKQLNAQGPAPLTATAVPEKDEEEDEEEDKDGGVSIWWFIGLNVVGAIGIGFLVRFGRN